MRISDESKTIQAQVGISIALARSIVASWLPPASGSDADKSSSMTQPETQSVPPPPANRPRAGLGFQDPGASSLSEQGAASGMSLEDLKLRRQLLHKSRKIAERKKEEELRDRKRQHHMRNTGEGYSDEDEEDIVKGANKGKNDRSLKLSMNGKGISRGSGAPYDLYKKAKKNGKR
ncbi:hypothetical protein PYCC9005_004272 [Savitreella phatthalungensis]